MATARPSVAVYKNASECEKKNMRLPHVFAAPLRADVIKTVHRDMNKNARQADGVKFEAGYDTAAASWGTGRAVARIPRVPGGGTHRASQGAFGNMCRGGGMFNPNKSWRRWHRKTNVTMKRHALAAAISATGHPALVMARGHAVQEVPELPLVVSNESQKLQKTKDAVALLKSLGVGPELERVVKSRKIRAGRGKARNRRYVMRKGPLFVYGTDEGCSKAFRNIPGVEVCPVERMSLLKLAPGAQFGRFVIYTEAAVKQLGKIWGTYKGGSQMKKGYTLPRSMMTNTDIARIINSNEVQSIVRPAKEVAVTHTRQRKNPLKNKSVLGRLSGWMLTQKNLANKGSAKMTALGKKRDAAKKAAKKTQRKVSKVFFENLAGAHRVAEAPKSTEDAEEEE